VGCPRRAPALSDDHPRPASGCCCRRRRCEGRGQKEAGRGREHLVVEVDAELIAGHGKPLADRLASFQEHIF